MKDEDVQFAAKLRQFTYFVIHKSSTVIMWLNYEANTQPGGWKSCSQWCLPRLNLKKYYFMISLHKLPGQALQSLSCFTHLHVSRSRSCSWSWSPEGPHRSLVVLHHIKWPAKKKTKLWKQEKLCTSESNPCFKNWEKKKNLWHIPKHPFIQIVASSLVRRWPEIIRLWESVWWAIWIWGVIYKRRGEEMINFLLKF